MKRMIQKLVIAAMLICLGMVGGSGRAMAQQCAPQTVVDKYYCTKESGQYGQICAVGYTRRLTVSCNQTTCQSDTGVCSSNDAGNCTIDNNCNIGACSPVTCGLGGGESCPGECRQLKPTVRFTQIIPSNHNYPTS